MLLDYLTRVIQLCIYSQESSQRFVKERDEQEVEYVSDGKVIAKEMRYAKENEFMERDGGKEDDTDWDSLSDRVKKSRRQLQKTLMRGTCYVLKIFNSIKKSFASENAERKDALTNRPLDFDKEEETRRKETYKWLDNHFGSESTSKDSRDDSFSDMAVEPTKKTYFNVTIKSNNHHNVANTSSSSSVTNNNTKISPALLSSDNELYSNKLSAPSKVYMPEREPVKSTATSATLTSAPTTKKFFQGISDWSERKGETPPRALKANPLSTKAFQEELSGTLERKQRMIKLQGPSTNDMRKQIINTSMTNLNGGGKVSRSSEEHQRLMKYKSSSRDDLLKTQKEDLGYLSGSRTDLQSPRKYTNDDYAVPIKKKSNTNGYLHREDSGFRDSKEDLRSPQREDSFGHDDAKQASIQRDDSAYVSSSTYFTTPRSPRSPVIVKTPDSGIRSPTPTNDFESDELNQSQSPPAVPQRKKAIERKTRVPIKNGVDYANSPAKPRRDPPIDYSPPPRSRSESPLPPIHHVYSDRKSYQKTRFSSPPSVARSIQTQTLPPKKKNSVGNAIGNSLRKLVGKIRSASAERKLKSKTPPSSSKRTPSPLPMTRHRSVSHLPSTSASSSYQRNDYVIDSHITNNYRRAPSTSTQGICLEFYELKCFESFSPKVGMTHRNFVECIIHFNLSHRIKVLIAR